MSSVKDSKGLFLQIQVALDLPRLGECLGGDFLKLELALSYVVMNMMGVLP